MLSIIIPQYKETFEFMQPLFTSIDNQRLIDFSQIKLIVVNDCGEALKEKDFEKYKHIRPHLISTATNSGVGVARQVGIDNSNGDFLMFIDADDCLNGQHSLFRILSKIYEKPDTELIFGQFLEEQEIDGSYGLYLHERDVTFCHSKVYNKKFLTDKNIKCHPTLRYNEDSYFNALVVAEAKKVEYLDTPIVIWAYNQDSTVRQGGLYAYKKLPDYVLSITDLCSELVARKKVQAKQTFLQAFFYIYFQLQDEAWKNKRIKEFRPAVIEAVKKLYKKHKQLYKCGETERLKFYNDCRKGFSTPIMENYTFNEYMKEITND